MGYFNSFYQQNLKHITKEINSLGISGCIIPDLPYEEALCYEEELRDITLIGFVAPTDNKERINTIVKNSKKFIYLVAYAGITGSNKSEDLDEIIKNIKDATNTPIYIGFGVNKNNAKEKSKNVDGVIVGSGFVKILIDNSLSNTQKIKQISALTKEIKEQLN
jgi:tryptophan synthase alpha chain